jgi:hypothetical protein
MELPYINTRAHLSMMMANYDQYAAGYNADIKQKRTDDPENIKLYQTLKPTHRAIFKDLILEMGKKMLQNINNYQAINAQQGNEGTFKLLSNYICGDGYYVCSTNRYQIAKHNAKELSTVYRNLRRLMDAGIITAKIGHGVKSNFELHIASDFLIVSDKANPAYNPLNVEKTAPTPDFSLCRERAKCKEEKNVQEHLINKIYSDVPSDFNSTGTESTITDNLNTGTITGTEDMPNGAQEVDQIEPKGGREGFRRVSEVAPGFIQAYSKGVPEVWHAFNRMSHAALFVDYLIHTIYNPRGIEIFPAARLAAIDYAKKYYFPNPLEKDTDTIFVPCQTLDQYAFRLNQLKWCIDAANRYAAKNKAYFVLITKYIDIANPNGMKRTFDWWKNAQQNEKDKAKGLKNIKEMKLLQETIRQTKEGKISLMAAENYIENHLPKYKFVFRHSLVTVVNGNV